MFKKSFSVIGALMLLAAMSAARAQEATKEAVKAMVIKAVADVEKRGIDTACKDFADPKGGFISGEIYIFVQDLNAKMICHATNPRLNGKDLLDLKDADDKAFNKEMVDIAKSKGSGWVDYRWVNPVSKQIQPKSSYIQRTGDLMVGAGMYRK